jgi:hypothetical protein
MSIRVKTFALILLIAVAILLRFPSNVYPQVEEPILTIEMEIH